MKFKEIKKCPLCGSSKSKFHSYSLPNLYSEKIAEIEDISEDEVIKSHPNLSCFECGLIYKKRWFQEEQLDYLFKHQVPMHPKGWDVVSGRFSKDNFYHEVRLFNKAIEESDTENINRYKRALPSIIDSIDGFGQTKEGQDILDAIENEEPNRLTQYKHLLENSMNQPAPFKRFSGFSAEELWNYIDKKVFGIKNYSEIGCPLWGLMPLAAKKNIPVTYYKRNEMNYWSENCKNNGTHCAAFLNNNFGVNIKPWSQKINQKQDVIGLFQYLDHLEKPLKFMQEIFNNFETAAVILDKVDNPVAIQHFTGFTLESLQFIANRFNKELYTDFEDIKPSGNTLYLFTNP